MPKRNLLRRFNPIHSISASVVAEEAKTLAWEVDNCEVFSAAEVNEWLNERHTRCRQSWDELQLVLGSLRENERRVIHNLLFRDFYHVLELYLCHIRTKHPEFSNWSPAPQSAGRHSSKFSEWLFQP